MKKALLILLTLLSLPALAEKVSITADAPDVVVSGEQFRLSFTVNSRNAKNFTAPSMEGFEVLMGPSRSVSSSTRIINGNMTSTSNITYTYMLMAQKEGNYEIAPATVQVKGETYESNTLRIKVLPPDSNAPASSRGNNSSSGTSRNSNKSVGAKDLFITATVSKTNVYEQEALLLTYKVYTRVNLQTLRGDMPDLKDFHTQEVPLPRQKQFKLEHYKGSNYNTTIWSQYVLFPQRSGKLTIPAITFEGKIAVKNESVDPFDAFFNGLDAYSTINKRVPAPSLNINVKPLPSGRPDNYSGGVGHFDMTSEITGTNVKTNDAVTLRIVLSGTGNMKLMGEPEPEWPADFEAYDPKTENNFKMTSRGLSGTKVIEYLAIPRHPGDFNLPPVEYSYFDTQSGKYRTLSTPPYKIHVEKGEGASEQVVADFVNKEDLKILGKDIRYIKKGGGSIRMKDHFLCGSTICYMYYIIPLILFIILIVIYRRQALENANTTLLRTKKAGKVADKRLKKAAGHMRSNDVAGFYDELLKALWGYVSDKLSIPVSQLGRENVQEKLSTRGVSEEIIKEFLTTLDDSEFARYAPGDPAENMDKHYKKSAEIIEKLEDSIKK